MPKREPSWTAEEAREDLAAKAPRRLAFAEADPGPPHGIELAEQIGYSSRSRKSLSSTVQKLRADPRVQAILRERRELGEYAGPIGDERGWSDPAKAEVPASVTASAEAWEANLPDAPEWATANAESMVRWMLSLGGVVPWNVKKGLLTDLRQIEKENARMKRDSGDHQLVKLRRMVTEILVRKRTRERGAG